jgi:hypothetical protein
MTSETNPDTPCPCRIYKTINRKFHNTTLTVYGIFKTHTYFGRAQGEIPLSVTQHTNQGHISWNVQMRFHDNHKHSTSCFTSWNSFIITRVHIGANRLLKSIPEMMNLFLLNLIMPENFTKNFQVRFEVLTAVVMKSTIFWDITPPKGKSPRYQLDSILPSMPRFSK